MKTLSKRMLLTLAGATAMLAVSTAANAQVNLTAETSSPGNSPHLSVAHIAKVLGRAGIADVQLTEGQTLTNTLINVAEGKTDISALPLILAFLLEKGRGPFSKQGENGAKLAANIRALYPYNAGGYGLITHKSTGIKSWKDLKGKTVFNGPPRGAALVNARQAIFMAAGYKDGTDYKGLQANWGRLPGMLVDGSADGFVVPLTFPSARVSTALAAGKVNIISTPKAVFESKAYQKLLKAPGNVPIVVKQELMGYPANSGVNLISEDKTFRGLGTAFADVVHKDMDFELAKKITAAHIASLDELKASTPYAKNVNYGIIDAKTTGFCGIMPLKYHPGAIAAWADAGHKIPDCAKP